MKFEMITVEQAKALAEEDAQSMKTFLLSGQVLFGEVWQGQYCWAFLLNREIKIPDSVSLGIRWAFFVSHWGDQAMAYDFSDDPPKMSAYVDQMSKFFLKKHLQRGESADE